MSLLLVLVELTGACEFTASRGDGIDVPATVAVPAGEFIAGSDSGEREYAYRLDEEAYGHDRTRRAKWYARERDRQVVHVDRFAITKTPITNSQYAQFVAATNHPPPDVTEEQWDQYGLIHPFTRTRRHAWVDGRVPTGREHHPVVLVSTEDALAYAEWLSAQTHERWELPSADQWEKAIRGVAGLIFPWGDTFVPSRLNSHDQGPFDTQPVGAYPDGVGEFGVLDGAGQVFEWVNERTDNGRFGVKGGSWDDSGCGVCRPAAIHFRPATLKHILIGFRLVKLP